MKRFPIRMITLQDENGDEHLVAICDDGTIWRHDNEPENEWKRMPSIPDGPDPSQQVEPKQAVET